MEDDRGHAGLPNHRVLVLNRLWQPVNIVGLRRAFGLLFQEHARVIFSDTGAFQVLTPEEWVAFSLENPPKRDSDAVHTVRIAIRVPRILLLNEYDKLPVKDVKFTRQSVFERDGYTCQYCGKPFKSRDLNLDHVIPRDRGGRTSWENIVTSCVHCNSRKANRLPHEAGMRVLRKPARPKLRPFVTLPVVSELEESWKPFLHASPQSAS